MATKLYARSLSGIKFVYCRYSTTMKILANCFSFFLTFSLSAQYLDIAPSGKQYYRVYEGGSSKVQIDWQTPVEELIVQFNDNWRFLETGKAYWIGYTDLMYSIAARKNNAINPLVKFIQESDSIRPKIGAIYTLHLIGIECKIVGRFTEEFIVQDARTALLNLLVYDDIRDYILLLLTRDPWTSDIPQLMSLLHDNRNEYEGIVSILQNYQFDLHPFKQPLPEEIASKRVVVYRNNDHSAEYLIRSLMKAYDSVVIDLNVQYSTDWLQSDEPFKLSIIDNVIDSWPFEMTLMYACGLSYTPSYGELNNKYYYTSDGNSILIYGNKLARNIWIKWWDELSPDKRRIISASKR